jgi:hypothetical protein
MTPQQIAELAKSLDNTSVIDLYTARYETHFRNQGLPAAEARAKAETWAKLKSQESDGFRVIDPDLSVDDLIMQHRMDQGQIAPSSITASSGIRVTAAAAGGAPAAVFEQPPSRIFPISNGIQLDRYSANPGREFYTQLLAGSTLGAAPEMFGTGPLPPFTASGIDPAQLRWVPWTHRHTAAVAESRSTVLLLVEAGLQGILDPEVDQSADGLALWKDYMGRVAGWVQAQPLDESANIDEQIARLYGPDAD